MPPRKKITAKSTTKQTGKTTTPHTIKKFMDTPAKRTRSASGKIQQEKMASQQVSNSQTNNALTPIQEIKEATSKEGYVAGIVDQINNSPNVSPVKAKNATKSKECAAHDKDTHSTMTQSLIQNETLQHDETSFNSAFDKMATSRDTSNTQLIEVFAGLNTTMQGIQTELRRLNSIQQENTCKVSTLEFVQKDEVQSMRKVQAQLDLQQKTIEMLVNHVTKQDERIGELTTKQNEMQARSMKRNILITGIQEQPNENCENLAAKFFSDNLGIRAPIVIKIAHRIGIGNTRPMVIKLKDANDKQIIFQNTAKLKGTSYFVSEQLPEEMTENKKLQQRLKGQNKQLPSDQQLQVNVKRDKVYINNELYKPAITAPDALRWLAKDEDEKNTTKRTNVTKGGTDSSTSSTFVSYAAVVKSTQDVQKAYDKVFTLEPRATHIVCAYLLPGLNFPMQQGGADDREFGASRQLLRKLQLGSYFHRAVFVARYYGGSHLGVERFRIYKEMAQSALDKLPAPNLEPPRLDVNQLLNAPINVPQPPRFTFNPTQQPVRASRPATPLYSIFTTPIPSAPGNLAPQQKAWSDIVNQEEPSDIVTTEEEEEDEGLNEEADPKTISIPTQA